MKRKSRTSKVNSVDCNEAIVATALSKCVFKQGRRTVSPAFMLKHSGLLPVQSLDEAVALESRPIALDSCASSDSGIDVADSNEGRELAKLEKERQRGMSIATSLAATSQNALENEFTAEGDALGKHSDGTGITGVVSTLAQLIHLKQKQIL